MPAILMDLVDVLVRRGLRVEIQPIPITFDSYLIVVRDVDGARVGTIQYRSPLDEPKEYAQGLSYG